MQNKCPNAPMMGTRTEKLLVVVTAGKRVNFESVVQSSSPVQ